MSEPRLSSVQIFRFGIFEVDLCKHELRKRGRKIRLQDQPFEVLKALIDRPGEVVTREELRQKLWPSDTFVDFDHGLNNAINRLRQALCDSSDHPLFIETIPRRGYRFVAPVTVETSLDPSSDPEVQPTSLEAGSPRPNPNPRTYSAID